MAGDRGQDDLAIQALLTAFGASSLAEMAEKFIATGNLATAGGDGSISVGGDANNAQFGGTRIELTEDTVMALQNAIRQALPKPRSNLPPDVAHFKGRGAEEAAILQALKGGGGTQAITVLKGIGGIGKSALAVRVARQLVLHYPAVQILVKLRGTDADAATPRAAMEDVIRRFEPGAQLPDDDDGVAELYRDVLAQHKSLLILDNAYDGAQVQSLLPPLPSAAIITSRRQVDLPNVGSHGLDNLDRGDAVALLAELYAEHAPTHVPGKIGLELLAAACADHPLALTVAGTYAANRVDTITVERYADQITERRETLKLQGIADHDVMASLGLSLERLTDENANLAGRWRDLAVFPADFDAAAAAAVWADDAGADAVYENLVELTDASFLEPASATERFRLHDLMRDLARLNQPEDRFTAAKARHGAHFETVLSIAKQLYKKGGAQNALDGLALYDLEQANIRTGQARAVATMKEEASAVAGALVLHYANAGAYVLDLRLHARDRILWWEEAAEGARLSENRDGEGVALGGLGLAYADLGETDKAIDYQEQRLVIAREIGGRHGEGNALGNLGTAYADLGEMEKAIDYFEQQLVIAREIGDRRSEGNALGNLGVVYSNLGDMEKAIDYLKRRLVIAGEIGDRRGEGAALGNLGVAYLNLGDMEKAIDYHEQQLVIAGEIGDRRGEGAALGNLGIVYKNLGEMDKAIGHFKQHLVIAGEIGDRRGEGNALANLGIAYAILKRFSEAHDAWTSALALYVAIDDPNADEVRDLLAALEN